MNAHIERERDFTRDASHELRTPLTVIRLAASMLLEEQALAPEARSAVERIKRAASGMEETTEALLLLARESERKLSSTAICLNDVVALECQRARAMVGSKPVTIEEIDGPSILVDANARVLAVLVGNLLRNAMQYTQRGHVEVQVRGDTLSIADTGIGIPGAQLDSVFEPFVRADNASHRGYGVGLSIVKRLCDRFGWTVSIESAPAIGTRVRVSFPSARAAGTTGAENGGRASPRTDEA